MLCLKCGYDMGNRNACPICGYETEDTKQKQQISSEEELEVTPIVRKPKEKIEKKIIRWCAIGIVPGIICLVLVLNHFKNTTHIWYENQYREVFYDNNRVSDDRNTILAVSNQGILSYDYQGFQLSDIKGRKKDLTLTFTGKMNQVLLSNSMEYMVALTIVDDQSTLNLVKTQDTGNIIMDANIDIDKLYYLTDGGTVFYSNKAGEFICWSNKTKQVLGQNITKYIVFEESQTYYFLQEDGALYQGELDDVEQPENIESKVSGISANRVNGWKTLLKNNDKMEFGYLDYQLLRTGDQTQEAIEDDNYRYGINQEKQLYQEDLRDGKVTVLQNNTIDFGIN